MDIRSPRRNGEYEDRDVDCKEALELTLMLILDAATHAGWDQREAMVAAKKLITEFEDAFDKD